MRRSLPFTFALALSLAVLLLTRMERQGWTANLEPAAPAGAADDDIHSMSREDMANLLDPPRPPGDAHPTLARDSQDEEGDKIEITTIEPDPDASPDAQASAEPVETQATSVGETGIL